ncbi:hypothetical protein [Capnocytophaga gingivalis]|jgi:hypothetical protein|uniref:hypothetical protein n=1 Tax=Capnocytophaga gingivalis TaxID=1017 RepID=UPI0023EFE174|nr:hypothetical protein [Capnocytophaga gingivalis]
MIFRKKKNMLGKKVLARIETLGGDISQVKGGKLEKFLNNFITPQQLITIVEKELK